MKNEERNERGEKGFESRFGVRTPAEEEEDKVVFKRQRERRRKGGKFMFGTYKRRSMKGKDEGRKKMSSDSA